MTAFKNILDPNEQVLWSAKPDKKSFLLPAFGGIPFALLFLAAFILILNFGSPTTMGFGYFFLLAILLGFVVFLIFVPPYWQYKKLAHVGYMITNQRLIVKKEFMIMKHGLSVLKK